ncbi:kelch repeat-containing protein [Sorangium sp. So ce1078]|uniref:kelch repeat-containing protein n=1 Tax=Sorangium sp. So ce1078 TaxID=3133329 RepID=UPI003F63A0F1
MQLQWFVVRLALAGALVTLAAGPAWADGTPSWEGVPPMTTPRGEHTATPLQDGRVLVAGGSAWLDPGVTPLQAVEIYDPARKTWTPAAPLGAARAGHAAVRLPSGQVLVAGGRSASEPALASAEIYDPASDTWTPAAPLPAVQQSPAAVLLGSGKALFVGHAIEDGASSDAGGLYDPLAGTWTPIPELAGTSATLLGDGRVLVVSRYGSKLYDPETDSWAWTVRPPYGSERHSATRIAGDSVLIVGGVDPTRYNDGYWENINIVKSLSSFYLPAVDLWTQPLLAYEAPVYPCVRHGYEMSYYTPSGETRRGERGVALSTLPGGGALLTGGLLIYGCGSSGEASKVHDFHPNADLYDPARLAWSSVPAEPPVTMARAFHTSTRLDDGSVLIAGGYVDLATPTASAALFHERSPLGAACEAGGDCASGFCADSVCCDAACDGPCDACAASSGASQDGACTPRSGGPCDDAGACLEAGVCEAGTCVGGVPAPDGAPCDDLCSEASTCQGGACVGSGPVTCQPPDDCHEAAACDPALGCAAPASEKPDGARCTSTATPDAWQLAAPMDIPSEEIPSTSPVATLLLDGTVLVTGAASVTRYDPSSDTWQPTAPTTITTRPNSSERARILDGHTATLLQDGRVLIAGVSPSYWTGISHLWWYTEIFDPATGAWTEAAPLNMRRSGAAATRLLDGRVLIAGGYGSESSAEVYDPVVDLWYLAAPMSEQRPDAGLAATLLPDGRVLVAGGGAPIAEVYDPAANSWSPLDAMSLPFSGLTATRLLDGRVLIAGGADDDSDWTAKIYDQVSGEWTSTGAMSGERAGHEAVLLADGRVLVTGGWCEGCDRFISAEIYDPASNTWTPAPSMIDAALHEQTSTRLDDGRVLVAGGYLNDASGFAHGIANAWLYVPGQPPMGGVCQDGACEPDGGEGGAGGAGSASTSGGAAGAGGTAGGEGTAGAGGTAGGEGIAGAGGTAGGGAAGGTSASSTSTGAQSGAGDPPDGGDGGCSMAETRPATPAWLLVVGGLAALRLRRRAASSGSSPRRAPRARANGTRRERPLRSPRARSRQQRAQRWLRRLGLPLAFALAMLSAREASADGTPSWERVPPMITPRHHHTATRLLDGRVLIAGGHGSGGATRDVELYDPASNTWTSAAPLRLSLDIAATAVLPNGLAFLTNGSHTEVYFPTLDVWKSVPRLTPTHESPRAVILRSGELLFLGNHTTGAVVGSIYDPAAIGWIPIRPLSGASVRSATLLADGRVLAVGGTRGNIYDPETDSWAPTSDLLFEHLEHGATLLPSGDVLLVGGVLPGRSSISSQLYLVESDVWVAVAGHEAPGIISSYCTDATYDGGIEISQLPSGSVLLTGGLTSLYCAIYDDDGTIAADWTEDHLQRNVELYEPASGAWSALSVEPPETMGRAYHTATTLDDGSVLIAGGLLASGAPDGALVPTGSAVIFRELAPLGAACAAGGDCASGFCADSVCCDAACAGPCDACAASAGAPQDGACTPLSGMPCDDPDACLQAGVCEAGACVGGTPAPDGTPCNDGQICSATSTCEGGACVGSSAVVCQAPDGCHEPPACDPAAGCSGPAPEKPDGARCDFAGTPDVWQTAAPVLEEMKNLLTATLLKDGTVLFVGEERTERSRLRAVRYDPTMDRWQLIGRTAQSSLGGSLHATLLQDGTVLVSADHFADRFDPATGMWRAAAALVGWHARTTATLLQDGRVLVMGDDGGMASAEVYDPSADIWTLAAPMNEPRALVHTATLLPDGRVLVTGDNRGAGSAEVYDPAADTWTHVAPMSSGRMAHTATLLPDGRVLVIGGDAGPTAELYDPVNDLWTPAGPMTARRVGHEPVLLSDGRVLVVGDMQDTNALAPMVELYDPASDTWTLGPAADIPFFGHLTARLDDGRALVAGGHLGSEDYPSSFARLYVPGLRPGSGVCQAGVCSPGGGGAGGGDASGSGGSGGDASGGGGGGGSGGGGATSTTSGTTGTSAGGMGETSAGSGLGGSGAGGDPPGGGSGGCRMTPADQNTPPGLVFFIGLLGGLAGLHVRRRPARTKGAAATRPASGRYP